MVFYRLLRGDFRRWLRSRGASLESYKEEGRYLHLLSESLSHGHVAIGKPSIRNTLEMKKKEEEDTGGVLRTAEMVADFFSSVAAMKWRARKMRYASLERRVSASDTLAFQKE